MIGRTLDGRFTILALVGVGSMGAVYRARQSTTEREVAIKVLRKGKDETAKARFLREARASSALKSLHVVRVFDFGETQAGELFLVMELLDGESLAQRLQYRRRLPPAEAVDTMLQALKALSEAHVKGLIHRDIKPANLFYAHLATGDRADETVKLLDFGGAKFIAPEDKLRNAVDTQEGFIVGTPRYMSPEQARGGELDGRSDLYSLGVVLYQMLAGEPPFRDEDPHVILARHLKDTPERPSLLCPEIPPALDDLVMRVLAKDPSDRPQSADALANELAQFAEGPRSVQRQRIDDSSDDAAPVVASSPHVEHEAETLPLPTASTDALRPRRRRWVVWTLAAAAVVTLAATGLRRASSTEPVAQSTQMSASAPSPKLSASAVATASASSGSIVAVDTLPKAPSRGTPAGGGARPLPRQWTRPSSPPQLVVSPAAAAPSPAPPSPAPPPSASSGYRYFE